MDEKESSPGKNVLLLRFTHSFYLYRTVPLKTRLKKYKYLMHKAEDTNVYLNEHRYFNIKS